ncbi:MAG TPA: VOC family protein [Streptosporangiaceae bacterium]|jgi:uncharacterized glyoxalase superfamily protein PhnB
MTDDLDPLRQLRPDRVLPDDPVDPALLARGRRRFLAEIGGAAGPARGEQTPSVYPRLGYRDERAALEFLILAFGFAERREARMEHPDGMLAWLQIGDGVVMIGRAGEQRHGLASPLDTGAPTAMVNVSVRGIDEHCRRARAGGARIVTEPEDMFWGDRRYEALDPEGHRWHFSERLAPDRTASRPAAE